MIPQPSLDLLQCPDLAAQAQPLVEAGVLSPGLLFIVDALGRRFGEDQPAHLLWCALVLEAQQRGHSALPADRLERHLSPRPRADDSDEAPPISWPALPDSIGDSPLLTGDPPLIACHTDTGGHVLQSHRMATEERWLAEGLSRLARPAPLELDGFIRPSAACIARGVARFGAPTPGTGDAEHPGCRALRALAEHRLAIITGGPGTGKTWSIKRILAMLLDAAEEAGQPLTIRLAAPTGKAGVRMREAMAEDLDLLDVTPEIRNQLRAMESATLHRLLRLRPGASSSRFGPDRPLPVDVVVVDEASMVDLPLMRRLVQAIGPRTRLILLGDRDQLPSVDVGSVLSDLVERPLRHLASPQVPGGPLAPVLARFVTNHRSGDAPTLAALVQALQDASDPSRTAALPLLLGESTHDDDLLAVRVQHVEPAGHGGRLTPGQLDGLTQPWTDDELVLQRGQGPARHPGYVKLLATLLEAHGRPEAAIAAALNDLLAAFDRYRILAVHRRGPTGVSGLTRAVTARIRAQLEHAWSASGRDQPLPRRAGKWLGEAVLITRNAYDLDLWNGDVGLVLPDPTDGLRLAVAFPVSTPDGDRSYRMVPLDRLPEHSGAFVLTVHKSQGSQFDHVAVVLSHRPSPIETRELVYTGITRASQRLTWVGSPEAMRTALATPVVRGSRLGQRLV